MVPVVTTPVGDSDDVRLDDYRRLQDHTLRRRLEDAGRFFVVEGWEAVRRLLMSDWEVRSVLVTEDKAHMLNGPLGRVASVPHYVAPRAVVQEVVGFDLHRGVIASAVRPEPRPWRAVAAATSRLVVLEGISDAENLGAIFRSAAALGFGGVLLAPTVPDPLYRRSVRVSMGAVLMVPFARVDAWPGDLSLLRTMGFSLLGLTPHPSAELIETIAVPERVALLLGGEAEGLSGAALAATDARVRIGQTGVLDSLNVGHAAAIAFYHFGRN